IRACSMSCVSALPISPRRWNSRRRHPKSSRSSQAHLASWSRLFRAMLESATRICEAKFGSMYLREGDAFRIVAMHNAPPAFADARRLQPLVRPGPGTGLYRVASTKQVVHIADIRAEQPYLEREPSSVTMVERAGARTLLVVPMLKDD